MNKHTTKTKDESGEEKAIRDLSKDEPEQVQEEIYQNQTKEGYNTNPSEQQNYPGIQDHKSSIIKDNTK